MKKKKVIIFDIQDDFKNFIKDLMPQRSLWKGLKAKIKNKLMRNILKKPSLLSSHKSCFQVKKTLESLLSMLNPESKT